MGVVRTKKEAFEYLKGTKVVLKTEDEQVKLQEFLFSIGYKWISGEAKVMKLYPYGCVYFMSPCGYITHNGYDDEEDICFCDSHIYTKLEIEDILGIEIDEEEMKWKDVVARVRDRLGDKQILVISKDNVTIIDL